MSHISYSIKERGITLIEIIVVIFIIALFSIILISYFPTIQRQSALSQATYKMEQDIRRAEDLGLSGVPINDKNGQPIKVKGYGIYISLSNPTKYVIYADVPDASGDSDQVYKGDFSDTSLCSNVDQTGGSTFVKDCAIQIINIGAVNPDLSISTINNINGNSTSINFSPPNPTVNIANISSAGSPIGIVLSNGLSTRTIQVNTSGLINVQ